jgi:hypothetical protein
MFEKIKH